MLPMTIVPFELESVYLQTLALSLGIQVIFFVFAAWLKTDKVTDLSFSITFVVIALYTLWLSVEEGYAGISKLLLLSMITLWALRLGSYLLIRIAQIKKDKRFDGIRESFWRFAQFWFFQGILVWLMMLPAVTFLVISQPITLGFISLIGMTLWFIGLVLETVADSQKFSYLNNPANKGHWVDVGLWRFSRHPNYFGEMLIWWGVFIYVVPVLTGLTWFTIVGPLAITGSLLFLSGIPPLERKLDTLFGENEDYQIYKKNTPLLIPFIK